MEAIKDRTTLDEKDRGTGRTTRCLERAIQHLNSLKNSKPLGHNVVIFVVKDSREFDYVKNLARKHFNLLAFNSIRHALIFESGEVRLMADNNIKDRHFSQLSGINCPIYIDHHVHENEYSVRFPHAVVNQHAL